MSQKNQNVDIIFLGNVGTGKSTLLSNLSGHQFPSGINMGVGKIPEIEFVQDKTRPGTRWSDTAGLSDIEHAEKAAQSIYNAFDRAREQKRAVKLFFVLVLRNGRLDEAEVFTIRRALESIKIPGGKTLGKDQYTVIINQVKKKTMSKLMDSTERFKVEKYFTSDFIKYPTKYIHYIPFDDDLDEADNAKFSNKEAFKNLEDYVFNVAPSIKMIEKVEIINTDDLLDQINDMKLKNKRLEAEFDERFEAAQEKWNEERVWYQQEIEAKLREAQAIADGRAEQEEQARARELEEAQAIEEAQAMEEAQWGKLITNVSGCMWDVSAASEFDYLSDHWRHLPQKYQEATGMTKIMFYESHNFWGYQYGLQGATTRSIKLKMTCKDGDTYEKSKGAGGEFDLCWSGGYPKSFTIHFD